MIFVYYLIALAVVLLDQLTKRLTVEYLKPVGSVPLIEDVLHLSYVENTGAAFGIMKNSRWLFMVVSAVAIAVLIFVIAKYCRGHAFASVAVAMVLGGGIGNMIDRVRLGYVIDFIDFRLINFAVFNVADSFVTVGVVMLLCFLISEMVRESKAEKAAAAVAEDAGEREGDDADDAVDAKDADKGGDADEADDGNEVDNGGKNDG